MRLGKETRANKEALGRLVSIEVGKIVSEGLGEVREMIDICDFAVGLSRQLYGLTIATERAEHRMMESWHPLGVTGIISAFNFPVAVWAWNAAFALVCGNSIVWNPSVQLQSITELPPSKPDFRSTPRDRTSQTRPGTPASCQRGGAR
jgi:aldehyde dehydrogenase (NAD+)